MHGMDLIQAMRKLSNAHMGSVNQLNIPGNEMNRFSTNNCKLVLTNLIDLAELEEELAELIDR
jgi:hypothetical protein